MGDTSRATRYSTRNFEEPLATTIEEMTYMTTETTTGHARAPRALQNCLSRLSPTDGRSFGNTPFRIVETTTKPLPMRGTA